MCAKFSVAMSDNLQLEFCRYKNREHFDRNKINRILRYGGATAITNLAQLERIGFPADRNQEKLLRVNGLKSQTLEELAAKTTYKIVLSDDRDDFPYVNITDDSEPVQAMTGGYFFRNMPREKAKRHIAAICASASRSILIYDLYLNRDVEPVLNLLGTLLPDKKLDIIHHPNQLTADMQTRLKLMRGDFLFEPRDLQTHHDRYIIIDEKTEIILTSGFYNLATDIKEFTYIIREGCLPRFA